MQSEPFLLSLNLRLSSICVLYAYSTRTGPNTKSFSLKHWRSRKWSTLQIHHPSAEVPVVDRPTASIHPGTTILYAASIFRDTYCLRNSAFQKLRKIALLQAERVTRLFLFSPFQNGRRVLRRSATVRPSYAYFYTSVAPNPLSSSQEADDVGLKATGTTASKLLIHSLVHASGRYVRT